VANKFEIDSLSLGAPEELVEALKKLDPLSDVVESLEAALVLLDSLKVFISGFSDPLQTIFLQLLNLIEDILRTFLEAGVYSIIIPPPVNHVRALVSEMIERGEELNSQLEAYSNNTSKNGARLPLDAFVDFTDPYNNILGGLYRVETLLKSAFRDGKDNNRPQFPELGTRMAGLVLLVDAPFSTILNLMPSFLALLNILNVAQDEIIGLYDPPSDIQILSEPGKVKIIWSDKTTTVPPVKYDIVRSISKEGVRVVNPKSFNDVSISEYEKDSSGNYIKEFDGLKSYYVPITGAVGLMLNSSFVFEDTTGIEGQNYYYSIRKSYTATSVKDAKAKSNDTLSGRFSEGILGVKLDGLILADDVKIFGISDDNPGSQFRSLVDSFNASQIKETFLDSGNVDFGEADISFKVLNVLSGVSIKAEIKSGSSSSIPIKNGRIKIDNEVIYYTSAEVETSSDKEEKVPVRFWGISRGKEGTVVSSHRAGSAITSLGVYSVGTGNANEPNFLPPIKLGKFISPVGEISEQLLNLLRSIAEGFKTAAQNIEDFISSIEDKVDFILEQVIVLNDALDSLIPLFEGIDLIAIKLPAQEGNQDELVSRITEAFRDSKMPSTSASNIGAGIGIFYGGPDIGAIDDIIQNLFPKSDTPLDTLKALIEAGSVNTAGYTGPTGPFVAV